MVKHIQRQPHGVPLLRHYLCAGSIDMFGTLISQALQALDDLERFGADLTYDRFEFLPSS
ncbi:hypothetical protein CRM94_00595 [Burkholderia gladioli]|uniref:Uncharacterized protein n=1 Tax=Burkholderia gladioli TaxID=28095 RepID=A0A2A7SB75_BURGA|nr:hypothetical protein CRM94_00595 [Burkholderia gladioli]PEH80906.1 hypothetical protein CRM95_22105 [Burkholderia gladioli]